MRRWPLRGVLPADQYEVVLAANWRVLQTDGPAVPGHRLNVRGTHHVIVILAYQTRCRWRSWGTTGSALVALGVRRRGILGLRRWEGGGPRAHCGGAWSRLPRSCSAIHLLGRDSDASPPGMARGYWRRDQFPMEMDKPARVLHYPDRQHSSRLGVAHMNIVIPSRHRPDGHASRLACATSSPTHPWRGDARHPVVFGVVGLISPAGSSKGHLRFSSARAIIQSETGHVQVSGWASVDKGTRQPDRLPDRGGSSAACGPDETSLLVAGFQQAELLRPDQQRADDRNRRRGSEADKEGNWVHS